MTTVEDIWLLINTKQKLSALLSQTIDKIKKQANELDVESFKQCKYETARDIFKNIQHHLDDNKRIVLEKIVVEKKVEKYPELKKANYFPEINNLDISDEEKVRLDIAARQNVRNYIAEYNIDKLEYKLSFEDLELLCSIGVVEKQYVVICPECDFSMMSLDEDGFFQYIRKFELFEKQKSDELSEEEKGELDVLKNKFDSIVYCYDCESELKISSVEQIRVMYHVVKIPDLTYEKL